MDINLLDWFGYLASLIVLISLLTSSILKLRWINLFGAALFAVYGLLINSLPTAGMNFGIVIIDIYYLVKIYSSKEYFGSSEISSDSNYLKAFLEFYKEDFKTFFGTADIELKDDTFAFYILRDMVPAGICVGQPVSKDRLKIQIDFATPAYRDFKIGDYIYNKHTKFFTDYGYTTLEAEASNEEHKKYLLKMGFKPDNNLYVKKL